MVAGSGVATECGATCRVRETIPLKLSRGVLPFSENSGDRHVFEFLSAGLSGWRFLRTTGMFLEGGEFDELCGVDQEPSHLRRRRFGEATGPGCVIDRNRQAPPCAGDFVGQVVT